MRYLVYHTCNVEDVISWSDPDDHVVMANLLYITERVVSGGFIEPKDRFCCGEVPALGIKSRGHVDQELIQNKYFEGR